jgi:hypothetical protein
VVRPMSVIGRFSIMPSWKDDGQTGSDPKARLADQPGAMAEWQLMKASCLDALGPLVIAHKPKEVVQHDRLGFFGRPSP